jgi:hypothetical protein
MRPAPRRSRMLAAKPTFGRGSKGQARSIQEIAHPPRSNEQTVRGYASLTRGHRCPWRSEPFASMPGRSPGRSNESFAGGTVAPLGS